MRFFSFSHVDRAASLIVTSAKFSAFGLYYAACFTYCYSKYMQKELERIRKERMENSHELESKMSIRERPAGIPFPRYGDFVNDNLLPYHISIIFERPTLGEYLEVGLGSSTGKIYPLTETAWNDHGGQAYQNVKSGQVYPIEQWAKFAWFFGKFPNKVDEERLRDLTRPKSEGGKTQGRFFPGIMWMPESILPRPLDCETKALTALYQATQEFSASIEVMPWYFTPADKEEKPKDALSVAMSEHFNLF